VRILVILPAAILLATAVATSATTYLVCPDGSGDFETIQAAIDAAADGDVIELCDATFSGPGNRDIDYLGKAIIVRSASGNPATCVMDCGGYTFGFCIHRNEEHSSVLEGVTVTNGGSPLGGAIRMENSSPTIRNCWIVNNHARYLGGGLMIVNSLARIESCVISGNAADDGGGAYLSDCSPWFEDCVIAGNSADTGGGGIDCGGLSTAAFVNCTITGNKAWTGGGIEVVDQGFAAMENVIIWGNCAYLGGDEVLLAHGGTVAFTCCDVDSSGVDVEDGTATYLSNNLFTDPLFCEPADCSSAPTTAGDYRLAENSPCLDAPGCGLIGALGEGCGAIPVEASSWGWIKSLYR
jgi:hypothetical protein